MTKLAAVPHSYAWPETRDRAVKAFNGDTPGDATELAIIAHFQDHPGRVVNLIDAIGRRVTQGQVRSGWAILKHELDHVPSDIVATDNAERATHLRLAELWIRHTGGYIDREEELVDALFGPQGPLREWPDLEVQVVESWTRERSRFADAEAANELRLAHQAETLTRLRRNVTAADPAEADAQALRVAKEVRRAREAADRLAYFDNIELPEDE